MTVPAPWITPTTVSIAESTSSACAGAVVLAIMDVPSSIAFFHLMSVSMHSGGDNWRGCMKRMYGGTKLVRP